MLNSTFRYVFLLVLLSIIVLLGCKRTETTIITNNTAPPDLTVTTFNRESYVNRIYISLMGRKPDAAELQQAASILPLQSPSKAALQQFLSTVMTKPGYLMRAYDNARIDYLNNLDTAEISNTIASIQLLISSATDPFIIQALNKEVQRLIVMQNIPANMLNGTLSRSGMHRICIDNWFYDQINMGSANFVISSFLNFFFRQPSDAEQMNGIRMVDGASASILLHSGSSKTEYLDIFFTSLDYAEGQVRDAYVRYLFREPTTNELSSLSVQLHADKNYEALQKHILSSDEYVYP